MANYNFFLFRVQWRKRPRRMRVRNVEHKSGNNADLKIPFLENYLTRSSASGQWEEFFLSAAVSVSFLPARIHVYRVCVYRSIIIGPLCAIVRMGATTSR